MVLILIFIFILFFKKNLGREICTSSAKSCLYRHARRLLLFTNRFGGFAVDLVSSAGTSTAVAWNVHRLQPTLSTPPEILTRSRIIHFRRPSHPQTQRRQFSFFFKKFRLQFTFSCYFKLNLFLKNDIRFRISVKIRLCVVSFTITSGSFTPTTTDPRPSVTLFESTSFVFILFTFLLID